MCKHRKVAVVLFLSVSAVAVVVFAAAGCRNRGPVSTAPQEEVMLQGASAWFPLSQLRQRADEHVQKHGARLSQARFEVTASVNADAGSNLVTFQYWAGFGQPVYYVTFDKSGSVANFTNRISTEYIQE